MKQYLSSPRSRTPWRAPFARERERPTSAPGFGVFGMQMDTVLHVQSGVRLCVTSALARSDPLPDVRRPSVRSSVARFAHGDRPTDRMRRSYVTAIRSRRIYASLCCRRRKNAHAGRVRGSVGGRAGRVHGSPPSPLGKLDAPRVIRRY